MAVVALSPDLGKDRQDEAERRLRDLAQVARAPEGPGLVDALRGADAYLCGGFPREFPEAPRAYERLRFVQTTSAGVDHVPFERLPPRVLVAGNMGAYDVALAEQAFALLLAAAKRVVYHADAIRARRFAQDVPSKQLRGSTLGVLGLGGIGREVARMGRAFGMRILGITRSGRSDFPADFVGGPEDLDRVLAESDALVIAVPHTRKTHGLIGAEQLRRMKRDAVLVNIARGDIVREADLFEHLRATPTFVAATDVWWKYPRGEGLPYSHPFDTLPNFLGTPHVGWNVPPQRMAALAAALENVRRFLTGEAPRNVVEPADYAIPRS